MKRQEQDRTVRVVQFKEQGKNQMAFYVMDTFTVPAELALNEAQEKIAEHIGIQHWYRSNVPYIVLCRGMSFTLNYD